MKQTHTIKNIRSYLSLLMAGIIVVLVTGFLITSDTPVAESSTSDNLSGYAWSETIGWISMNCTNTGTCGGSNYGVTVAGDGSISGYAWSEHIGWLSFNASDVNVSACPDASGTCAPPRLDRATGAVSGWARALAHGGGWDGFVSLSGTGYGVTVSGCDWSGYAWGSDVVGWVQFDGHTGSVVGTGDACMGNPDLTPTFNAPTGPFVKDTEIDLAASVRNNGGVSTGVGFSNNFTYRWNTTDAWQEFAINAHPVLLPGGTVNDTAKFTPRQTGTLYLQYCADATRVIYESGAGGESNNCVQHGPFNVVDGGTPVVTTLTGTDCTIPAGQNSCYSLVTWTTENFTDPQVKLDDVPFSSSANSPVGGQTTRVTGAGTHRFSIHEGTGSAIRTVTVNAVCPSTAPWNGTICNGAPPVGAGTPSLKASPRIVEEGKNTTLTWDTDGNSATTGTPETSCVLTGGSFGSAGISVPGGGVIDQGSIETPVYANTTYTITCPAGGSSASVRVEVIPRYFPS